MRSSPPTAPWTRRPAFELAAEPASPEGEYRLKLKDVDPPQTCIPPGPIGVTVRLDRHQTRFVTIVIPPEGKVTQRIELECTPVSVDVIDCADRPFGWRGSISLVEDGGARPPQSLPVSTSGRAVFFCVKHGRAWLRSAAIQLNREILVQPEGFGDGIGQLPAEKVKVCASQCGVIIGRVTGPDGAPVSGATVVGAAGSQSLSDTTAADGTYRIPRSGCLDPGAWDLEVFAEGFEPAYGQANVAGTEVRVDFVLERQRTLPTLWPTGVGDAMQPLLAGSSDPHWILVSGPGVTAPRPAVVLTNPAPQYHKTATGTETAKWVGADAAGVAVVDAPYVFQMEFDLTGFDPASARIAGEWSVDNTGRILLNGNPPLAAGSDQLGTFVDTNFTRRHGFSIAGPFVPGANRLEVQMINRLATGASATGPNPAAFFVDALTIVAVPAP